MPLKNQKKFIYSIDKTKKRVYNKVKICLLNYFLTDKVIIDKSVYCVVGLMLCYKLNAAIIFTLYIMRMIYAA